MIPFLHVTSHIAGRPDDGLLEDLGRPLRFPTLLFLDAEGRVAAVQRTRSVQAFERTLDLLEEKDALEAAGEADRGTQIRLFVIEAQLGTLGFEAARERLARLGEIPEEQAPTIRQLLTNLEVDAVLEEHGRTAKTAKSFLEMHDAGRIPSGPAAVDFWLNILYYLRGTGDDRYPAMVEAMAKAAERDPQLEPYLRRFR